MSTILVFGEGAHELGKVRGEALSNDELPALLGLIYRIMGEPPEVSFECEEFKKIAHVHGTTPGGRWAGKVKGAILRAKQRGADAAVIVIDRDRKTPSERLRPLEQGRDAMDGVQWPCCAVGVAVETFDAWMIADGSAIGKAGGAADKSHGSPESLDGSEKSRRHPKAKAEEIFGTGKGMADKYAIVAQHVDLELLKRCCPEGFAPFAKEVEDRLKGC